MDGDQPAASRDRPALLLLQQPVVAGAVLLAAYVILSLANNPHGYLGTDTGAKVATLRIMADRHRFDPDVGYWAARWDPTARVHPFFQTSVIGHRYVIVTTLPALYLGEILYRLGGYRTALLVPEFGSVAAAFAARALARRIGGGSGWLAFWVTGLASPLTIYALDFWEHSVGVALIAWGVVLLLDIYSGRRSWRWGLLAGFLFGAAATMRTEALVYGAVATGLVCLGLLVWPGRLSGNGPPDDRPDGGEPRAVGDLRSRVLRPLAVGLVATVGLLAPLAGNTGLERASLGGSLRNQRVTGTAASGGAKTGTRVREAVTTAIGIEADLSNRADLFGLLVFALLAVVAARSAAIGDRRPAVLAALGVVLLYVVRASGGLGFTPGLVATTPLAVVGLVWAWREPARRLVAAIALVALPLVWAFQFPGGAVPQWGGRYILASGLLLAVLGVAALPRLTRWAQAGVIALAVAVTVSGVAWLSTRSRQIASAGVAMRRFDQPVLVSRVAFLVREWGAYYGTVEDRRWLTAGEEGDLNVAVDVLERAGVPSFAGVALPDQPKIDRIGVYHRAGPDQRVDLLNGVQLIVTPYTQG